MIRTEILFRRLARRNRDYKDNESNPKSLKNRHLNYVRNWLTLTTTCNKRALELRAKSVFLKFLKDRSVIHSIRMNFKKSVDSVVAVQRKIKWRQKQNIYSHLQNELFENINKGIDIIKSIF